MEPVTFLKFWKLSASPTSNVILPCHQPKPEGEGGARREDDEEEDSFFDLELLSVSTSENQKITGVCPDENSMEDKRRVGFEEEKLEKPTKLAEHIKLCYHDQKQDLQSFDVSQADSISKRKILPIEPSSKPQSPIQLLRSAPKFPVFIFKKQKSMGKNKAEGAEPTKQEGRALSSKLSRENSTRKIGSSLRKQNDDPSGSASKRFSKEVVQKYLKLIRPLYDKVLKKYANNSSFAVDPSSESSPVAASVDSPMREKHENFPAGIRLVCKHLGKSKSASAAAGALAMPPSNRRDDSLLQQHDGIQGAILHCKRSFNASTEHSLFSRADSAPSHGRPRSLSCKEFSLQESKEEGV